MNAILLTSASFGVSTLLETATTVLTWFITSLGSILTFFTTHTALLVWFVVSLVGAAFVWFRKLI